VLGVGRVARVQNVLSHRRPRGLERRKAFVVKLGARFHREEGFLRNILNFNPGPQGWTSPLGMNLAPRGEICPLEGMFTPSFTPSSEHSLLFRKMEWRTENFTPRGEKCPLEGMFTPLFIPGGEHSLLFRRMEWRIENFTPGLNSTPRGEPGPQGWKMSPIGNIHPFVHPQGWTLSTI
jgi:hypothetical protein